MKHVNATDFEELVIKSQKPTLVDFYAEWCGPCKRISVVLDELSAKIANVDFVKVDVDANQDIASNYNISSIPTLILFKNGEPINQIVGAVSKSDVEKLISQAQ